MFVDTNILVFSTLETSPRHHTASARLYELHGYGERLWISRQVLREYLAVVTRLQPHALSDAVTDVRRFERIFSIAEDGPSVLTELLRLLDRVSVGGRQIHDANIVATMLAHGINRLLTDNVSDFSRFSSVIEVVPLDG